MEDAARGKAAGMNEHLTKPIRRAALEAALLRYLSGRPADASEPAAASTAENGTAVLDDVTWTDLKSDMPWEAVKKLANTFLTNQARELEEMKRRHVPIVPIVCELNSRTRCTRAMEKMAASLEFLPDPMVIEAEWRANQALAQKLEEDRAQHGARAPSTVFLRQARFALVLGRLLGEKNVSHVHATSSNALVCALILKKLFNVTVSATIEARPNLPR